MLGAGPAFGAELNVLVIPFDAEADLSEARKEVMAAVASSLDGAGAELVGMERVKEMVLEQGVKSFTRSQALDLAEEVRSDFVITGELKKSIRGLEATWNLIDALEGETVAVFVKSGASSMDLAGRITDAAPETVERMRAALVEKPAAKTGVIDRIEVSGNRRVDTEAILQRISSVPGEPFDPDDVREDIRSIYSTGYFDDVVADLRDTPRGKVLTFRVTEMPFIRYVRVDGNEELDSEKINSVLTLKENTVLDRALLLENTEKIKALYKEEGFFLTEVEPVVRTDELDATVIFKVDEGPMVRVKRITIIGNEYFSGREIRGAMNTKELGVFSFITDSGRFNEFIFQNDLAIIMSKYFDNGFIEADVTDHRVLLSDDKKWFYITIALTEGEQYTVGEVDVRGDILTSREDLLRELDMEGGEVFNRSQMSKGIEALADVYGNQGYAYADIRPLTRVDKDTKTIDITVDIDKNELVYVERVDITGNVRTRDKVIRRELEVEEGQLFNTSDIKKSRNNLRRLGYFEDVKLSQTRGSEPDKVNVTVDVRERPTGSISVGMGYSSVDKLIGTASISQSNFLGTGVKLELSGTMSASSSRYVLGVTEPWLFDKPISAGFDLYNTGKEYPDFEIEKRGFSVRFGFPIYKRNTRAYLTYKLEDVNIFDVSPTASTFIKEQEGNTTESSVKVLVRHDTRDDAFFPTEGILASASVEVAGGPLGGTTSFVKYEADAAKFFPLPWETTFSVRGEIGYLEGYEGQNPPIYERYFLGGINSIRGFETRSVGPRDPTTGELIGGTTKVLFNAEFLFPVMSQQNLRGVLFFDAGNAYEEQINLKDLRYGAGAGVRWFSPMGPLRLELGFNLNRREGEKAQQWEFAIGTMF